MKWINVEDELPEPGITVLVTGVGFFNSYDASVQRWELVIDPANPKEKPHWFATRITEPYQLFCITHWMPLPKAPKKVKTIKIESS